MMGKNPELKVFTEIYVLFQHYAFLLSYLHGLSIKDGKVEDILGQHMFGS